MSSNNIKEKLELIRTTLEIILILKPVLKLAWTKIKEFFQKEKNYVAIN